MKTIIRKRQALMIVIRQLKLQLLQMQERIVRQQRFGTDSLSHEVSLGFERESEATIIEQHALLLDKIRRLDARYDQTSDEEPIMNFSEFSDVISECDALKLLLGDLKKQLCEVQESIVRQKLFGTDSIFKEGIPPDFEDESYARLIERHTLLLAEIRRLDVIHKQTSDKESQRRFDEMWARGQMACVTCGHECNDHYDGKSDIVGACWHDSSDGNRCGCTQFKEQT